MNLKRKNKRPYYFMCPLISPPHIFKSTHRLHRDYSLTALVLHTRKVESQKNTKKLLFHSKSIGPVCVSLSEDSC